VTDLSMDQRADILRYASALLGDEHRADPVRVGQAALPLLEWAERAPGRSDLSARMRAMSRQYGNMRRFSAEDGDPAAFANAAMSHYDFLTAGPRDADADWPANDPGLAGKLDAVTRRLGGTHGDGSQDS
jgi:hypothetical protein